MYEALSLICIRWIDTNEMHQVAFATITILTGSWFNIWRGIRCQV